VVHLSLAGELLDAVRPRGSPTVLVAEVDDFDYPAGFDAISSAASDSARTISIFRLP
jgi:hypothetical protein